MRANFFGLLVLGLTSLVCTSWEMTAKAGTPQIVATGLDPVVSIAVNGGVVYFGTLNGPQGTVSAVPASGGSPTTLASGLAIFDSGSWRGTSSLAFDSQNVYAGVGGYVTYEIVKIPKLGGLANTVANLSGGYQIGIIGNNLFYGSGFCCIGDLSLLTFTQQSLATGVWVRGNAINGQSIYFYDHINQNVDVFDSTTNNVSILFPGIPTEPGVTADNTYVYLNRPGGTIYQGPQSGGSLSLLPETGGVIGSDDTHLYIGTGAYPNGTLEAIPISGGTPGAPIVLASPAAIDVATFDEGKTGYVYWADDSGGPGASTIYRVSKPAPFAGTPGDKDCHGDSASALAQQYGGIAAAAQALSFPDVRALQNAVTAFCGN